MPTGHKCSHTNGTHPQAHARPHCLGYGHVVWCVVQTCCYFTLTMSSTDADNSSWLPAKKPRKAAPIQRQGSHTTHAAHASHAVHAASTAGPKLTSKDFYHKVRNTFNRVPYRLLKGADLCAFLSALRDIAEPNFPEEANSYERKLLWDSWWVSVDKVRSHANEYKTLAYHFIQATRTKPTFVAGVLSSTIRRHCENESGEDLTGKLDHELLEEYPDFFEAVFPSRALPGAGGVAAHPEDQ